MQGRAWLAPFSFPIILFLFRIASFYRIAVTGNCHDCNQQATGGPATPHTPLSWRISERPEVLSCRLLLSRAEWIQSASLRRSSDLLPLIRSLLNRTQPVVLRGIDEDLAEQFRRHGYSTFQSGIEAAIDLSDTQWHRPSLRELARRALRFGSIEFHPAPPFPDIAELRSRSVYARLPALKGLYLTEPYHWLQAWSFQVDGTVLGLVTVSRRSEDSYHTEILMRASNAPQGTMEALILQAATDLKSTGARELSLGECPFVTGMPPDIGIHPYGRLMSHAYHARGLYDFKAKFKPRWRPVYICSRRNLVFTLIDLSFRTGSAKLFATALIRWRPKCTLRAPS